MFLDHTFPISQDCPVWLLSTFEKRQTKIQVSLLNKVNVGEMIPGFLTVEHVINL